MSHGGLVAAHSHDDGAATHHVGHAVAHVTVDDADHQDATGHDDHDGLKVDHDDDGPAPHPSTIAHSHIVVDTPARPPLLAGVRVLTLRFEPPLHHDALPPSATVAPGLEPPDA
jgi:hypothetical protein